MVVVVVVGLELEYCLRCYRFALGQQAQLENNKSLVIYFSNSLLIYEENTKENHKRIMF